MNKLTLVYGCLLAASVSMAGTLVETRNVRTSGRADDPESGMYSPRSSRITNMNDYAESAVYEIEDEPGFPSVPRARIADMNDDQNSPVYSIDDQPGLNQNVGLSRREFEARKYGRSPAAPAPTSSRAPEAAEVDDTSSSTGRPMMPDSGKPSDAREAKTTKEAGSDERDVEITRQIRRQILSAGDLSTRAQNLTVVTEDRKVSLRGTVPSLEEKTKVEKMARGVNGVEDVDTTQVRISQ